MSLRTGFHLVTFVTGLFIHVAAQAGMFSSQYISFELPPNWNCKNEGTEWVCISQLEKQAKEAIIILTAKEAGPTDSLQIYEAHVKTPRVLPNATGKNVPSQVLSVKQRLINGHPWVDGMHLGSEIASYYTRYLVTVKDRLAIAVTFSAHKAHYTKYSQDFLKSIESLRVIAPKDMFNAPAANQMTGTGEVIGGPQNDPFPAGGMQVPTEPKSKNNAYMRYGLGLLLILAALVVYLKRK